MDSSLNDIVRPGIKEEMKREAPPEDQFSDGLTKLRKDGEVSVWIVFASRVVLDINEVLSEDAECGYKELRKVGADALKVLDFHSEGDELVPGGNLCWHVKDADIAQSIYNIAYFWLQGAPIPSVKALIMAQRPSNELVDFHELPTEVQAQLRVQGIHNDNVLPEHEANARKMDLKSLKPAKDHSFIYNKNPLYCGTLAFNIAIDMGIAGIKLANHQLTIFATAHLYNALQQTNIIQGKWPEMDRIIEVHIGQLFAGALPKKPSECHTRLSVRLGASASEFARNKRKTNRPQQLTGRGMKHLPKLTISEDVQLLSDYTGHKEQLGKSLYRMEAAIQEQNKAKFGRNKRLARRQLTSLQFLTQVRAWLPEIIEGTEIDYINMVRICHKLLRRVRKRIHQRLGFLYPKVDEGFSNDHGQIFMATSILNQAAETQYVKEEVFRARERGTLPQDPHLEVAGEVMQDFLDKHGASWVSPLDERETPQQLTG